MDVIILANVNHIMCQKEIHTVNWRSIFNYTIE